MATTVAHITTCEIAADFFKTVVGCNIAASGGVLFLLLTLNQVFNLALGYF